MRNLNYSALQEIKDMVIDYLNNEPSTYISDLHHEIFNTDYFIIGRYESEQWLSKNYGVFSAINRIQEYENQNFGEVITDLSEPEHICNMLVYIIGEELLQECDTITENWDETLTTEMCTDIIKEIEAV